PILPPAQIAPSAPPHRLNPVGLGDELDELSQELLRRLVADRDEAVGLVLEELVEGVSRHARGGDDLRDRRGLVAVAAYALEHRANDALALGGPDGRGRELVPAAGERLTLPLDI